MKWVRVREQLIRDAVTRWAYERFAHPRRAMENQANDGLHPADVSAIRDHYAEYARTNDRPPA